MISTPCFPAVLFDYNGVLVDDEEVHLDAFRRVMAPLGISISRDEYWNRYLGFDDLGAFDAILRAAGQSPTQAELALLVDAKRPIYMELARANLRTFEGAAEIVTTLADQGLVGIVSGALRDEIELGLSVLCARDSVAFIISAEDTAHSKPDPEGYLLGIAAIRARLGAHAAKRAIVIEDSLDGVQAAKAAGLICLAVCHSYSEHELRGSGADEVTQKISDITVERLLALAGSQNA